MEIPAVGREEEEGRRTHKQLYGALPRLHLNKSSHSEAALSKVTFSLPSSLSGWFFPFRAFLLFHLSDHSASLPPTPPPPISLSFPFSQLLTIEPFMWPHFETWHGRLEGARGDTEAEEEETKRGGVRGGCGGGGQLSGLFFSELFHGSRNIIFSTGPRPAATPELS